MKAISLKILSILFALVLALQCFGFAVYAEDEETSENTTTTTTEPAVPPTTKGEPMTVTEAPTKATTESKKKAKEKANKSLKEQKAELEKNIARSQKLLSGYSDSAKATETYINALDEKIGYLNEELNVIDAEVVAAKQRVDELDVQIAPLEKKLKSLMKEYERSQKEYDRLNGNFRATYDAYCLRLRAMYVSGQSSILAALLTSKDLSQFLNRFEMVKVVAQSDTALLRTVNKKMQQLLDKQNGLNAQKAQTESVRTTLDGKRAELKKEQDTVAAKQKELADKKVILAEDRAESDRLFAEYTKNAMLYTEFRNEDEKLLKQVNDEIDALIKGLKDPSEVTTAAAADRSAREAKVDKNPEGELFSHTNAVLNLSYPVPGHHGVSQAFGHYRNGKAHTGIDYPCPMRSKVVATQKGIVVKVKRLNYSYGHYVMIYHGTDAKGRKVLTLYAHNSNILVSVGQSVRKGQQIAYSGSTGNSTGPHCHFEVIIGGSKVNPKKYVS